MSKSRKAFCEVNIILLENKENSGINKAYKTSISTYATEEEENLQEFSTKFHLKIAVKSSRVCAYSIQIASYSTEA